MKRSAVLTVIIFLISFVFVSGMKGAETDTIRFDFSKATLKDGIPDGWTYRGKPFTPGVTYTLVRDKADPKERVLKIVSQKGSGVILKEISKIDLRQYRYMRWRWKVAHLPVHADARIKSKDDQGIAIYLGYGKITQESISYAWQTETPKGSEGDSVYNGLVNVRWFSVRDKKDGQGIWYTEERNVADDLTKRFGEIPKKLALSISSNSQYTGSDAISFIDYIEFSKTPMKK